MALWASKQKWLIHGMGTHWTVTTTRAHAVPKMCFVQIISLLSIVMFNCLVEETFPEVNYFIFFTTVLNISNDVAKPVLGKYISCPSVRKRDFLVEFYTEPRADTTI